MATKRKSRGSSRKKKAPRKKYAGKSLPTKKPPRKKSAVKRRGPSNWYYDVPHERALTHAREFRITDADAIRDYELQQRAGLVHYLKEGVKQVRKYFHGFEPENGFDLNEITKWRTQDVKRLRELIPYVKEMSSGNKVRVPARSAKAMHALQVQTGQQRKDQYAFTIAVDSPETTRVRVRDGRISIERDVPGAILVDRYYLFEEYFTDEETGDFEQPESFTDIIKYTKKMMRFLPDGRYVLLTETHGDIAEPVSKKRLLEHLEAYRSDYGQSRLHQGFAGAITGFRFLGQISDNAAMNYMVERDTLRSQMRAAREAERRESRRNYLRAYRRGIAKLKRDTF